MTPPDYNTSIISCGIALLGYNHLVKKKKNHAMCSVPSQNCWAEDQSAYFSELSMICPWKINVNGCLFSYIDHTHNRIYICCVCSGLDLMFVTPRPKGICCHSPVHVVWIFKHYNITKKWIEYLFWLLTFMFLNYFLILCVSL